MVLIQVNKIQSFVVCQQVKLIDYLGLKKREMLMFLMLKEMLVQTLVEAGYNSEKFFIDMKLLIIIILVNQVDYF